MAGKTNSIKNFLKKLKEFNLQEWFLNLTVVKKTIDWAKNHSLPGFAQVPIYDVIVFLSNEIKRYDLFTRANSTAFSFFLSLFPSLIAFFTLIPVLKSYFLLYLPGGENFDFFLQQEIMNIMPGIAGQRLFEFIEEVTNRTRFDLLSFGFLLAVYFASNGMLALMRGFDKSYLETFRNRNFLKKRLVATLLTFQLAILLIGSVVLLILGHTILQFVSDYIIDLDFFSKFIINLFRWIAIIALFYSGIAVIYRYGASYTKKFEFFSPGATLATILCILTSVGFSYYVDQIKTENQLYGTIWTIIVIMLWLQLNSLVLLIGFELNASIAVNRDLKEEIDEDEKL